MNNSQKLPKTRIFEEIYQTSNFVSRCFLVKFTQVEKIFMALFLAREGKRFDFYCRTLYPQYLRLQIKENTLLIPFTCYAHTNTQKLYTNKFQIELE